jgi:hypothetical protein
MMDRRLFLKLTGMIAAASAASAYGEMPVMAAGPAEAVPAVEPARDLIPASRPSVARLRIGEAGSYQITGTVRLEASQVEISGIANSQQISWSGPEGAARPLASFTSFEQFSGPGLTPEIRVSGGQIESLSIMRLDYV